jgi:hypothetical protein
MSSFPNRGFCDGCPEWKEGHCSRGLKETCEVVVPCH